MDANTKVRIKRGDHQGRHGVVRETTINHAGIEVAWVTFKDGSGMEIPVDSLAQVKPKK